MYNNKSTYILAFIILIALSISMSAQAELLDLDTAVEANRGLTGFGTDAGYDTDPEGTTIVEKIGSIIQVVLGFVGTLFLILIIWSGFQWMTAGGNTETITKAKQRIVNATIGLVIVLAAYSITWFITTEILTATNIVETTP